MLRAPCLVILFLTGIIIIGGVALLFMPENDGQTMGFNVAQPQPLPKIAPANDAGCTYYIRYGDNLFRIGLRYGVSYDYLAQVNGIPNPNLIYAGNTLSVPCNGGTGVPVSIPQNCGASATYTVVAGDNLFRIAYNFKTSLDWVRAANNMYGRVLRPGMVLTIPCPNTVQYKEVPPPEGAPPAPTEAPPPAATPTPPEGTQITITATGFDPQTVAVIPGTFVIWVNQDTQNRTIVVLQNGQQVVRSPSIPPGGTWYFQFNDLGNFDYQFGANPSIHGTIQVRNP